MDSKDSDHPTFRRLQHRKFVRIGLMVVLLLAAWLRFHKLDDQSFWNDEGNSARIAERSIPLILEGAAGDIHPPLYYLSLHVWRIFTGESEFALRAFSAFGGIFLVVLIYALGTRIDATHDSLTGLIAASLAAINPFQIYYSQEARMYVWVALLGTAATYAGTQILESTGHLARRWSIIYILMVALGLYTHYLFPLAMIALSVVALATLVQARSWRRFWQWLGMHGIVALIYLPWAPIEVRQVVGWPSNSGAFEPVQALLDIFRLLTLGNTIRTDQTSLALFGFSFILIMSLIPSQRYEKKQRWAWAMIWLWLLIPIALVLVLGLYKPSFVKFLLIASPALCLLLSKGLCGFFGSPISRFPVLVPLALSLGLALSFSYESVDNLYNDPAYARADYRGIAQTIELKARPGDAVILDAANQWEVFTYYFPNSEKTYPLPRSRPVIKERVVQELENIAANHDRIFAIFWAEAESDPERVVERWLDTHTYKASDEWWGDVRLVTYAVPDHHSVEMEKQTDATFGDEIYLEGYTVLGDLLQPGDVIQVTLFWEALTPIDTRYKTFIHLLDEKGVLVAQRDSEPGGGLALTTTWEPGKILKDQYGVPIPSDLPSGTYRLSTGLYLLDNPTSRLPVYMNEEPIGDALELGAIIINKP